MPPEHLSVTSGSESESIIKFKKDNTRKQPKPRSFVCNFGDCKETFSRVDQFDRHYYHHDGIKKHLCLYDNCTKSYTIITHLKRHIKTFHEKKTINISKDYKCNFCDKKFEFDYQLQRHTRDIHEQRKTYSCLQCDMKYPRKIKLKRHQVETHAMDYPYKCGICNKGFLIQLQQRKHNCKNTYPCPICNEQFSKWSELIAHKSSTGHTKIHSCSTCGKTFPRPSLLKIHEIIHNPEAEKIVFKCPIDGCSNTYNHRQNLNVHINRKHENKTFKCTVEDCGKELSTNQKLLLHIKNVHTDSTRMCKKDKKAKKSKRIDSGKPKISVLSKLVGLAAPLNVEKELLNRDNYKEIEIALESTDSPGEM